MKLSKNKELAFDAIICSIIIILTFVKPLGYPVFGVIATTTVHIPVLIAIAYYKRWSKAIMFGTFFGLSSLVANILAPSVFSGFFINPLISVLPRILMALIACLAFKKLKPIPATIIGSYANTIFVLTALGLFYQSEIAALSINFSVFIQTIVLSNALVEAVIATIITTTVIKVIKK